MTRSRLVFAVLAVASFFATPLAFAAPTNFGIDAPIPTSENVITPPVVNGGPTILYCPSEADDFAYRTAISALTGNTVDYFNAATGTPTLALLQQYTCVYTWANSAYNNPVAFGNVLADYVDGGGKVLLGGFCTYTSGNALSGRIMGNDYCPVRSPGGNNHFNTVAYAGNGTSYQHRNVTAYSDFFRDFLVLQGWGIQDGTYLDGEIATAFRGDGRVMYMNAVGPPLGAAGDFARIVANFALWVQPGGVLYGCDRTGKYFVLDLRTGAGTLVGQLPMGAVGEMDYDDLTGRAYVQSSDGAFSIQPFAVGTGAGLGPPVGDPGSFASLEPIFGSWYGCFHTAACGASQIAQIDPTTGAVLSGPVPTGVGPIAGMAWNFPLARMYYVTGAGGGCGGTSTLYWNPTFGSALNLVGPVGFNAGSLEWGPDDNLYGGSTGGAGQLYRINPTNGVASLIGASGFGQMTGLMLVSGTQTVGVGDFGGVTLSGLELASPVPNPSTLVSKVTIRYSLAREGAATVAIYNVAGRRIWSQDEGRLEAGEHSLVWDGRGEDGHLAPTGIYFVQLSSSEGTRRAKMLRL